MKAFEIQASIAHFSTSCHVLNSGRTSTAVSRNRCTYDGEALYYDPRCNGADMAVGIRITAGRVVPGGTERARA